jgi:hypothetical protein
MIIIIIFSYLTISNKCDFYTIDSLPSSNGRLSVARAEERCSRDEDERPIMFALLFPGERIGGKSVFLKSTVYKVARSAGYQPLSIFPKWIDEHNLLIAAPEGSALKNGRNKFRGVHIQYDFYPMDSDKIKDEYLRRQVEKRERLEPRFRLDHGIGLRGIGCNLDVTAYDGEYLDQLELSMAARTTFASKASDRGKIILNPAYSTFVFNISARDEIQRPDKHATGADVIEFAPKDGRSRLILYSANYPNIKAPNGRPAPKWQFGYRPKSPNDIISIAEKLKSGTIAIRVGFWLDNEVVVYSGEPIDQKPIEMFEQCIKDNRIFDTPRHRTDQD